MLPRLLNYFSFVFSSALVGALALRRADILLVESPPLFLGLTANWLARLKKARMIFNVSDLYPETAISLGYLKNAVLRNLLYRFEAWCYNAAWIVTGQAEGIVDSIRQRFPDKQVLLLTNGIAMEKFADPIQEKRTIVEDNSPHRKSCLIRLRLVMQEFMGTLKNWKSC